MKAKKLTPEMGQAVIDKMNEAAKKESGSAIWKGTMTYSTEENLPPLERLILELRGNIACIHSHRVVLFWLLMASLVAHAIR